VTLVSGLDAFMQPIRSKTETRERVLALASEGYWLVTRGCQWQCHKLKLGIPLILGINSGPQSSLLKIFLKAAA
jgi:hypothetical protein